MDIEYLQPEKLELTLRLSDLLYIEDLTVAAAVLASFDWNIQHAIRELRGDPSPQDVPPRTDPPVPQGVAVDPDLYSYDVEEEDDGFAVEEESNVEFASKLIDEKKKYFEEQHASLVPLRKTVSEPSNELLSLEYHRQIANESRAHREDYLQRLMHKSELICQKIIESNPENQKRYQESKRRVENNREFINSLYTTYHPKVNFTFGTFLLNLTRSYLEGKYLLVYIHSIAPETEDNLKRLLEFVLQQKRIANVVNRNCIVYGMFDNSDDYEILQKYIPLKSLPAFALFRLSKSKKAEEFISAYTLSQKQLFLEWFSASTGVALTEKETHGEHVEEEKTLKQKLELIENEKRRKAEWLLAEAAQQQEKQQEYKAFYNDRVEQDELYAAIEQSYLQKRQLSKDEKERLSENEESLLLRREAALKEVEPEPGENVIEIKFRMPITGEPRSRRFLLSDRVEKCFLFVDCFCREEFEEKFSDFDIMQTHPTLILSSLTEKTLGEVFEDSRRENVIVKERLP